MITTLYIIITIYFCINSYCLGVDTDTKYNSLSLQITYKLITFLFGTLMLLGTFIWYILIPTFSTIEDDYIGARFWIEFYYNKFINKVEYISIEEYQSVRKYAKSLYNQKYKSSFTKKQLKRALALLTIPVNKELE